jgi:Cu2+-exporting ATPase
MKKNEKLCLHCKTPLVRNQEDFCCIGCESAHRIINKNNLNKYYEYCTKTYNTQPRAVQKYNNKIGYISHISTTNGENKIKLLVENITCGACVWLIETALMREYGVKYARINMTDNSLTIVWQGDEGKINTMVATLENLGYKVSPFNPERLGKVDLDAEHDLLKRMAVAGFGLAQVMMISIAVWSGFFQHSLGEYLRLFFNILIMLIAVPCLFYSAQPFVLSAYKVVRKGYVNMDVPISLSILVIIMVSLQEIIASGEFTYFDSALMLVFFLLIGRYLDLRARNRARKEAVRLIMQQSQSASILQNGKVALLDIKDVQVGDYAIITAGEKIPVDGVIVEGETDVNNSVITGESIPVAVKVGERVSAGAINLSSPIKVRVTAVGEDTMLAEIVKLIENAEHSKSKYVQLADKLARYFTTVILLLATGTFIVWFALLGASSREALLNAASVMIIACPCALGLAVPVVNVVATSRLFEDGCLVKNKSALERLAEIDTVVFDKTGTLTANSPKIHNADDFSREEQVIIASLAGNSHHPLSLILQKLTEERVELTEVKEIKGQGVEARFGGSKVQIGSGDFCEVTNAKADDVYLEVWFCQEGNEPKRIIMHDTIPKSAKKMIDVLKGVYQVVLLSGDRQAAVKEVASALGIKRYYSEKKPQDKYKMLDTMAASGHKVAMVGDGLNDSAALSRAHASLSPRTAIDLSQNCADVIYHDISAVSLVLRVARLAKTVIKQNFAISIGYNVVTVPLAMMGYVNPVVAALAMSLSSICVILNSLRINNR